MARLCTVFCVLALSLVAPCATAGILTLTQNVLDGPPALEEDSLVVGDVDDALALEQSEIQERFSRGLGVGLGVIAPWQMVAIHGFTRAADDRFWTANLGGGAFDITGIHESRTYVLGIDTYSLVAGHRWMTKKLLPFFVEAQLGYGAWRGRVAPKGSDPATDTVAATLDSSFATSGLIIGAQIGILWMWENGVFLEYSIFRVGRGLPFTRAYSTRSDESRDAVRANLERWYSWGFANLTLGWAF